MKNRYLAACLLLAGCAGPVSTTGPEAMSEDLREVRETIEGFEDALRAGDFAKVSSLLHADVLVLESGGAERSREEYLATHARADAEFLKGVTSSEGTSSVRVSGELAWATNTSQLRFERDGKARGADAAETMILQRGPEGWKIVHIHWSSRPLEVR
jgi:ketosteroid isomerase-like protein